MYAREREAADELARAYKLTAAQDICDILADRAATNKALRRLDCFELDKIELIEPNVHNENFDWIGFMYSNKFNPVIHIKSHFADIRIPSLIDKILQSVSDQDKTALNTVINNPCELLMFYAACLALYKNNKQKQEGFYDELNIQANEMKFQGRTEEHDILSKLGNSYKVLEKGALKGKVDPIILLLQRISRLESAGATHTSYLNADQLRGICRRLLAALKEIHNATSKPNMVSRFLSRKSSDEVLAARSKEIYSLTELLKADTREEIVKIIEESKKLETPSKSNKYS